MLEINEHEVKIDPDGGRVGTILFTVSILSGNSHGDKIDNRR